MMRLKPNEDLGLQRAAEFTVTTLFWLAWLYLIMPLVSLLLWMAGIQLFVDEMIVRGGLQALIEDLLRYGLVVLGMLLVTLVWVNWNLRHYGGHNKRTHQPQPVNREELAAYCDLPPGKIAEMQSAKRTVLSFDLGDRPVIKSLDE